MTKHRFFVFQNQIQSESVILTGDQARQISTVLRLRKGDSIHILDNKGWEYETELLAVNAEQVTGYIVQRRIAGGEPTTRLTLYQSLLKRDRFEWVLQKGTEIGITSFVPMITERTVLRQKTVKQNKLVRWQRIIFEAAEQSGRGRIPNLSQPIEYAEALSKAQTSHLAFVPWENESNRAIKTTITLNNQYDLPPFPSVSLFIGPEGGFTDSEVKDAQSANIIPVTLGPRILRAETAAIVATTLILHEMGEIK